MSVKRKKIAEWLVIGLFIAIVSSVASISIYRSVVNSERYNEKQAKKSFSQVVEKLNTNGNIKNIKIDDNIEIQFIDEAPNYLFDDMSFLNYEHNVDIEKIHWIWNQACVTVFFNDGTAESFFITDDGKVFYNENVEIFCPSLIAWYNEVVG